MSSNFPTSIDSFVDPTAGDTLNSPAHTTQHSDLNDAIEKIETKVGANNSAVNTTHDYKLSSVATGQKAVSTSGDQTIEGKKTFTGDNTHSGNNTFSGANTFSGVNTYTKAVKTALKSNTDGATITFDLNESNLHTVTLGGNRTLALSNPTVGQCFIIRLKQDGTGNRLVTWFSTIKWPDGSAPTLTTTANKVDTFGFICTASGQYDGYIVGQNLG